MTSATPIGPRPYDDLESSSALLKPFWAIKNFEDEEEVCKWNKDAVKYCLEFYRDIFDVYNDNLLIYQGSQWINQDRYARYLDRNRRVTRKSPKIVINHLADLTEQWVSKLTRFKPAIKVFPTNAEYEDEEDARISQYVIDHIWYQEDNDTNLQAVARMAKSLGEANLWVLWDPTKGDRSRAYAEFLQQNNGMAPRIPLTDAQGNPVNGRDGEQIFIEPPERIGDVKYQLDLPWQVLDEPTYNKADRNWTIRWDLVDVDYLKAKYPHKANEITVETNALSVFEEHYYFGMRKLKNEVPVFEIFHRHHEFLGQGRYIKCTSECLLESSPLPYSHGQIPCLKFTDFDVPGLNRGLSFYQILFPIQFQINAVASLIYKALVLYAHPKIVMPEGSCNIEQLVNENTIVSYRGAVGPQLMTGMPVPQELFRYLDKLEVTEEKLSGIFTMSRGEAPDGVRAAKALRVLEEQEQKRDYITITKFNNEMIIRNAKLTLPTAADYYDDSDGRLLRIVGKNNQYLIRKFERANLSKPYDIRLEGTTALSKSPTGRIQDLVELQQVRFDPQAPFTRQQFFNVLDFGNVDEFLDVTTRAVMCAKSENEDLLSERYQEVPPPTPDEDLITHWIIHRQATQSRTYKQEVPQEYKQAHQSHMLTTEYLMFNKAFGTVDPFGMPLTPPNQAFHQRLIVECPDFPVYLNMPPVSLMSPEGMPQPPIGGPPPLEEGAGVEEQVPMIPEGEPPPLNGPTPAPLPEPIPLPQ